VGAAERTSVRVVFHRLFANHQNVLRSPSRFFEADGPMPEQISLRLAPPPQSFDNDCP
jgi:hypothetical protein